MARREYAFTISSGARSHEAELAGYSTWPFPHYILDDFDALAAFDRRGLPSLGAAISRERKQP